MKNRKEMKRDARQVIKKHYFLLVAICVVAAFFGAEFNGSVDLLTSPNSTPSTNVQLNALPTTSSSDVLIDILDGKLDDGDKRADEIIQEDQANANSKIKGRTNGVLAQVVNNAGAGKYYLFLANSIHKITNNPSIATGLFILLILIVYAFFFIFVKNIFRAVLRRIFLESRAYGHVPFSHLFIFNSPRQWLRSGLTLILADIYLMLWSLTIVGGMIKYFSYIMVPYIVAENPDIKPNEAITLSRAMMNGHKKEVLILFLTWIPWFILSVLTFGLTDIFWFNPYQTATMSEFYAAYRQEAIQKDLPNCQLMNDTLLYEKADAALLKETYADADRYLKQINATEIDASPLQQFLARNFAIWIGSSKKKLEYQKHISAKYMIRSETHVLNGNCYPTRLRPGAKPTKNSEIVRRTHFVRCYSIWSILTLFFALAFVGWAWEVSLHLVEDGVFVNRGSLHGPWLPIYGMGATLILVLLARFRERPIQEFLMAIVVSAITEYSGSVMLEHAYHMKWWDYTGYYLNLNGRICAEGLLVFALGGMLVVYLIAPLLDALISRLNMKIVIPVLLIITACYIGDTIYSKGNPNTGKGITDYKNAEQTAPAKQTTDPDVASLSKDTILIWKA